MSLSEQFPVTITSDTKDLLTLYDHEGAVRARDVGPLTLQLPRGLYTLRTQYKEQINDQIIRIDRATTFKAETRNQNFTAAPIDAGAAHYEEAAVKLSTAETRPPLGSGEPLSHLMVFVRAAEASMYKKEDLFDGLSLLDEKGEILTSFSKKETERDVTGWGALSAKGSPGFYLLLLTGSSPRMTPICLYKGWSTHIFITFAKRPIIEEMIVFMSPFGSPYSSSSDAVSAVDLGLWALRNASNAFPRDQARALLDLKFENPMVGLVGAHILIDRPEAQATTYQTIISNLGSLLGPLAEDVRALAIRAWLKWPGQINVDMTPFSRPPMLRAGMEAVLRASADHPELIAEGSLVEQIASNRFSDSAWSSWSPDAATLKAHSSAADVVFEFVASLANGLALWTRLKKNPNLDMPESLQWFDLALLDYVSKSSEETISDRDVARKLRLPRSMVRRRIENLKAADPKVQLFVNKVWSSSVGELLSRVDSAPLT